MLARGKQGQSAKTKLAGKLPQGGARVAASRIEEPSERMAGVKSTKAPEATSGKVGLDRERRVAGKGGPEDRVGYRDSRERESRPPSKLAPSSTTAGRSVRVEARSTSSAGTTEDSVQVLGLPAGGDRASGVTRHVGQDGREARDDGARPPLPTPIASFMI